MSALADLKASTSAHIFRRMQKDALARIDKAYGGVTYPQSFVPLR
jgi:hypothetical protein